MSTELTGEVLNENMKRYLRFSKRETGETGSSHDCVHMGWLQGCFYNTHTAVQWRSPCSWHISTLVEKIHLSSVRLHWIPSSDFPEVNTAPWCSYSITPLPPLPNEWKPLQKNLMLWEKGKKTPREHRHTF